MNNINQGVSHIQALYAALLQAGFKAKIWKDQRIYLNGFGLDISAFFIFDDPASPFNPDGELQKKSGLLAYTSLKVFTDAGAGKWAINRRKEVLHAIGCELAKAGISKASPPPDYHEMIISADDEAHAWIS